MIALEIIDRTGGTLARSFDAPRDGGGILIGRAGEADLILDKGSVSKRHARIVARGDRYLLRDLGSTNGTYLNSRRIRSEVALKPRDRIYLGEFIVRVLAIDAVDSAV